MGDRQRLPSSTIGQRKVLDHATHERISIQVDSKLPGYFVRGQNQRLRFADVDSCEAAGWIERTTRCTFRITQAGKDALAAARGVESTVVRQRVNNESEVTQ